MKADACPDHLEAVEFVKRLRPGGPWVLTAIVPDGRTTRPSRRATAKAVVVVRKYDGRRNLYYAVNPTSTALTKKAAKVDSRRSNMRSPISTQ